MDEKAPHRLRRCSWPSALLPSLLLGGLIAAASGVPSQASDATNNQIVEMTVTPSR